VISYRLPLLLLDREPPVDELLLDEREPLFIPELPPPRELLPLIPEPLPPRELVLLDEPPVIEPPLDPLDDFCDLLDLSLFILFAIVRLTPFIFL